jgi:hypothetical protein
MKAALAQLSLLGSSALVPSCNQRDAGESRLSYKSNKPWGEDMARC